MGGLSSGPGPGLCLLTLVVLIVAQQVQSAPVQEDNLSPQSRAQGYYDGSSSELSSGCYYNFQHYGEGDRIITNEPCLNCTCHNRMLMCYLRVCPFTKAIGQNCTIEKKPGQCCPLIICPEVPVQLLTSSTTTEHSESLPHRNQIGYGQYGTAVGHLDDYGCKINGEFYANGAQIPGNIDKPCEVCYCIRNRTACIMQECTLQVEGCIPVYEEGLCCPVRYQCDYEYNYNAITTEQPRPTPGLVLTTTTSGPFECQHDNKWYADGSMVETEDSCEHCYCMKGDIVCAVQECRPPFEKDGHNCTAMPPAPGKCCPDSYHCDGNEIVDDSEPTFRQDRMHKFGQNNANITMSITSSTSSGDKQHSWHYGTSSNENEMPNRFTGEHDKDGTTKPGKPTSDSDMMVTEGVPPTTGPLESGSHHVEGYGGESGMRPMGSKPSTSQGHGVSTDNMLTISQVIQSIVQNQTNLFNQNRLNQTGKPEKKPSAHDDKIVFPTDMNLEKKPGLELQTDEESNPIESHISTTDFPNEYYGFTGSLPNIYAEHGGRPQKKPSTHKRPGTAGTQGSAGQSVSGESQDIGGHKRPGMAHDTSGAEHGVNQYAQKKPIIHQQQGMAGTLVLTDDEGNPIEIYEGEMGGSNMVSGQPGSSGVHSNYDNKGRPQRPGVQEGFTGRPGIYDIYSSSDEYGHAQKRPVVHKKPAVGGGEGGNIMGSQDLTGKPGTVNQPEIFGEHGHIGRPHKKPITHKEPGTTDDEMATETYEGIMGGPTVTDEHGQPQSRPGTVMTGGHGGLHGKPQKKPGLHTQPGGQMSEDDITEGYESVTKLEEDLISQHEMQTVYGENDFTGKPITHGKPVTGSHGGESGNIYYDKYGKPHKRPMTHKRPSAGGEESEDHLEGTTEILEAVTEQISSHNENDLPSKKPQIHIKPSNIPESNMTDEDGNPIEEISVTPGGEEFQIFHDKYGRPHKRPTTHKKPTDGIMTDKTGQPFDGVEGIKNKPHSQTDKPEDQNQFVYYDQNGRPHKRPVTNTTPLSGEKTDEHGQPLEGTDNASEFPEFVTGKPGTDDQYIFYDQYGRPHKRPVTQKKPGEGMMTNEHGEPIHEEDATEFPEGFTGKPETDDQELFYDQYGRPHKRPVSHIKPGVGEAEHQQIFYDEQGRPHKRPVTQKKPGEGVLTDEHGKPIYEEGVTDYPEGVTGKPGTGKPGIFYDQHGRPHKRPVTEKKPGEEVLTDEHGKPIYEEGVTDYPEGVTGKPGTGEPGIFYDQHGRPHKRPVTQKKPVSGVLTDEHGEPVDGAEDVTDYPDGLTGKPGSGAPQFYYDQYGRPHKRPVTHKRPGEEVMTDEHAKPVDKDGITDFPEGVTGKPGIYDQYIFFDQHGRPHKRPVTHQKPVSGVMTDEHGKPVDGEVTNLPDGVTNKPGTGDQQIFYDQFGRPHNRPESGVFTDEDGNPIDGLEDVTEFPEYVTNTPGADDQGIFYDQYGRPHRRPISHTKPGVAGTKYPQEVTGKPQTEDQQIFYDEHGQPHKRPVTQKKPVSGVLTDEHGEPVDGVEDVTDYPEGVTIKPGDDQQIFYDQHGRPHKRPVSHKKPGEGVLTDEHGKPIYEEGVTDYPEGVTGKPGTDEQQIFYDQHGRPHKKPVTHKKPGEGVVTDEHGKPVDGIEDTTEFPEGFTGKPETSIQETFYDEHGKPHKRPVTHKKPVEEGLTDENGKPVHGEDVTEFPEGVTGKPGMDDQQIYYDEHGRPHKRPVTQKKPISGVLTDKHGEPVDGVEDVTDYPEGVTLKPGDDQQIFYDQHGRPHKRPVSHKKPGEMMTDEHDKPIDEAVTDFSEGVTSKPEADEQQIFYDEEGHLHKRPISQKKPISGVLTDEHGKPVDGEYVTDFPEGVTGKPGMYDQQIFYDQHGRPHKRPVSQKKPGEGVLTDDDGKPIHGDGVTDYPEGVTGKPGTDEQQIFYDQHGRPHKKPVTHKKPGEGVMTDEHGEPVHGEDVTEFPEGVTGKPGMDDQQIYYDEHGRPHKRPVTQKKPVSGVLTDEEGKPVHGDGVTDYPEGVTGKPGMDEQGIFYDEEGRPHKRPVTEKKPGEGVLTDEHGKPIEGEGITDFPHGVTVKPGTDDQQIFYDEQGRPHKRPVTHEKPGEGVLTDEHGKPVYGEGVTDYPEGVTGKPGMDDQQIFYDLYGRPHKRPVTHKKPGHGDLPDDTGKPVDSVEEVTDIPEGVSGKPGFDDQQIYYDEHGQPHKRPVTQKKPGEEVMTDEHGKPVVGEDVTEFPEGVTDKPGIDDQQIFYDPYGQPHKRPVTQKKPGEGVLTDEHGRPIEGEGITDFPHGVTVKPGTDDQQIFFDEQGRPHKRPVTHKKPGEDDEALTDEHTEAIEFMTKSPGYLGELEHDTMTESMIVSGHTGKPDTVSGESTTRPEGLNVITDAAGISTTDYEGIVEMSENKTVGPSTDDEDADHGIQMMSKLPHGQLATQVKPVTEVGNITTDKMVIESKPGGNVMTDEKEHTLDEMTETPEKQTLRPGEDGSQQVLHPHGTPHKQPEEHESAKPGDQLHIMTEIPEGMINKPESDSQLLFFDQFGRPHKRPVAHKKPGEGVLTDENDIPVDGAEDVTDFPESVSGKPGSDEQQIYYDEHGRPHKRPVTQKKPVSGVLTDEEGKPVHGDGVTDYPEGVSGKPGMDEQEIFYDEEGRPHKRPVTQEKPGEEVMTNEHGKPIDGAEDVTDYPEGVTGKPGDDQQIFYDEHGRPHKRPVTHEKPGEVLTDEHGKPIHEEEVTDFPDGLTGKPEPEDQEIFYDKHGRPHKRPVTQKTPVSGILTDEHGEPVDGVEDVTDYSEGVTGKPGSDHPQIIHDEHGRPHKKPGTLSEPDDQEGTVESAETVTGRPENSGEQDSARPGVEQNFFGETGRPQKKPVHSVGQKHSSSTSKEGLLHSESLPASTESGAEISYDEHGQPHKKPVTHKKPEEGVLTDEHGIPIDGAEDVTDYPQGFTGKPGTEDEQIFYDEQGRPNKRPVAQKKPVSGILTDEKDKPVDGVEDVTDFPESVSGKPGSDVQQIFYDEQGRPHKRPVSHKKPSEEVMTDEHGKPTGGVDDVTDYPEGITGKPGMDDQQIYYDEHGRPHKRPVTQKKPVSGVLTDEEGKPVHEDGVTDYPEGVTGKPGMDEQEIFYDEEGRPHKRPVTQEKPGEEVITDEHGKPIDGIVTELPEGIIGKPGMDDQQIFYDEQGRPHKRPVTHEKPGEGVLTDEHGKPVYGEGVTDYPEGVTGKPGFDDQQIYYDEHGQPHKRPVTQKKPGEEVMTDEHGKPVDGEDVTAFPESVTGKPGIDDQQIFYDPYGQPQKRPVTQKKPVSGILTDEEGNPIIEEGVTDYPEGVTGKPGTDEQGIFYDQHSRPHKRPVIHKKPGDGVLPDDAGKPVEDVTEIPEGVSGKPGTDDQQIYYDEQGRPHKRPVTHKTPGEEVTEYPGVTGQPESDDEQIFYDKFGRPHKRPVTQKKPVSGVLTDEEGKPVHGEGVTDYPEGVTGKPGMDDQQIFYDQYGRPHKKPVSEKKPESGVLTDEHVKPVDDVTKSPGEADETEEDDAITEIMVGYGLTGKPDTKPNEFIPGPEGVLTMEEIEGMTKSPASSTAQPVQTGTAEDVAETYVHGKPLEGEITPSEEHTNKPGVVETSEVYVEPEDSDGPQEKPHTQVKPTHRPQIPPIEHGHPEQEGDTHPVYDDQKPISGQSGVTDSDENAVVEDLTEAPDSGTEDQPMIFGEQGQAGRPHKRPVKPTEPETSKPETVSGVSEGKPEAPASAHGETPGTTEDHEEIDKMKPELGKDKTTTTAPEKVTLNEKDQLPHQKPDMGDSQTTDDVTETSDKGITGVSEQQAQKEPTEQPDEETVPVEKRPEVHSSDDTVTNNLGVGSTEIYTNNLGQPQKRPVHTRPTEADEAPEISHTSVPTISSEHGLDDDQQRPLTTSLTDEAHTTEGVFHEKPHETAKPDSSDVDEKKPEFDLDSKPGRPDEKPLLKPVLDVTGVMVDETGEPQTGTGLTEKPDIHDEDKDFKPSKRPEAQEVDEGIESTTKISPSSVHDTKVPGFYDGQKPISHKPEENEIFGVPEKDDDSITKLPEAAVDTFDKLSRPQKKPGLTDHDSEDSHIESPDLLHHYPQQQHVPTKTPEGDHPNVGDDTSTEDDDESLIITTDESEEGVTEMPQVHETSMSEAEEKPSDTKTKIPSDVVPGPTQQGSTPGLVSQADDFTTPVTEAHDASGVPVTEKDGIAHAATGKPEEHISGTSTASEDSKPDDVTTPKGISETSFPTTDQVSDKDHAKPASDHTVTGSTPISEEGDDKSQVPEKDTNKDTPAGISDATVGHGDTHPDLLPSQGTDKVTDHDESVLPGVTTPVSTPEGTHGVPESAGSVPSGEIHSVVSSTTETPGKVSATKPASHQPPHIFIPYLPPDDGSSTTHPILIDEGLHESSAPFDDIINNLANILRPTQTTEEPVGTTEDHGEVPGEGSCFMDGVTYQHNAEIPPLSPCHTKCTCISSIIHCLSLKCPPPPEDVSHCNVVHEENRCCPTYVCGTDVSPIFTVENHEGEITTDTSADKDESTTVLHYEPSEPTKPLAGVTSQKPEDSDLTDQELPIKHETDDKTSQDSKPGVVSESKKPQSGNQTPEESDKDTFITEKPEGSTDDTHTSQGLDHVMSPKPEFTGAETSTESQVPTKTSEDGVKPDTPHFRPGEFQSGYHPIFFGSKHPSTILPIYFGTEKPELPYQSHHKPESVDHVLGTDEPDQEGTERPSSETESDKPHGDKQKPAETDSSAPEDFDKPTTNKPVYYGTTKPVTSSGGLSQDDKIPDKFATGEGEYVKPEEPEKETEPSKLHEHDKTDDHPTLEGQTPVKKPVEHPDEINANEGKPQTEKESVVTEELEHQTDDKPGEKEPQIHASSTSQDEETVHSTFRPDEKPETDVKPSYMDKAPGHAAAEPHGESPETEESYNKPQSTDEPETDFVHSSSQKPELDHEPTTPDLSEESSPSIKRPASHDKPSEEEEDKETSSLDVGRPTEMSQTQKPGQPTSKVNETETMPVGGDLASNDKAQPGALKPTTDAVAGGEEPYEKPEESTDKADEILAHTTSQPIIQSESGKPLGETTDTHKKPQFGQEGEETSITSEEPHKEFTTEIYPSPAGGDSAHIGPHEGPSEEFEDNHGKRPSVHPTSMDNESAFTTEDVPTEDKKPEDKPETEVYPTVTDDKSSPTKPGEKPSGVDQSETKPESGEGLVERPTEEGSDIKEPAVSEKPVFGENISQGEEQPDLLHSTTESQITHGKPEDTKPQHLQDFSSTIRPKPTGVHKPQTDDIPEEVLLHPTRMPGTYETEGPEHVSDVEEDITDSQRPHTENENVATIFPEGIIRPITKRPIFGTGKPVVSDNKESTTPGYPFVQLGSQTSPGTVKPEETFEVTAKPIFDIMTDIPEDFAQIFGIKPSTVYDQQPDKHEKPEHTTHFLIPDYTTRVPDIKPQITDHIKRPIHSTNGTHFIQYVPYKEGEMPLVPEGATLGELLEKPDGEKYWPIIYMKLATTTPAAELPQKPFKPTPQQVFNGTHFIQYVPYDGDNEPEVPEGAELGQPQKGPDGQIYWPIIGNKPIMSPGDRPITEHPYPGQVFNGTHFIQYVPFKEGQKPKVPENATLGEPENAPNGDKLWPIISNSPIAEDDSETSQKPLLSQPEQIFNGTHFIQFAPYNDGQEPEIPNEATLGQPQKGPDGQIYWPIIDTKPLPVMPDKTELTTEQPFHALQVFNGTNFIQYVPSKDGVMPEVPEGATLGEPEMGPDGQIYWPIIYMRPRPVTPQGSFPEQVYNGTNFIQYVPYKDGHKPEVPSHATLGQPQKAPDGQMYWPIIYMKPVTAKPEDEITTARPPQGPHFNGTHYIQYVPYMEGFEPDIPEEASLGKPEKKPDGEMYWPIIYQKLPTRPKPETVPRYPEQFFNGTHFVQYLPYRPSHKPQVPDGVTISQPQKGPDGQMYWVIVSTKPLPPVQEEPIGPQYFNGTHFIQYVPYENEEPEVPEEATLGKPETGLGGQKFWPIIYKKPLQGVPITHQKPTDQELGAPLDPYKTQIFNGTRYIVYVPYVPGKTPNVPEEGVLGEPTKQPDGQIYWPIIFRRPVPGVPVSLQHQFQTFDPIKGPVFNGTHYVQYVPYKPGERPIVPEGATLGQPTTRPNGQLYWPIFYLRPVQETPDQEPMLWSPYDDFTKPQPEQIYNGTHFIQYLPYNPTRMPEVPEGATLGQPQKGPGGQMYWVIISDKPLPAQIFNDTHVVQYVTPVTPEQYKPQTDQNKPIKVFNGTHYIQYVPYIPGQQPVLPEGASLGQPTKGPEGQMYWPIIYMKPQPGKPNQQVPTFWGPGHDYLEPTSGQIFNGTHYIRFIKYHPNVKPVVPEGATISEPQRRPDGQLYWVIASKKPLFDMQVPAEQHTKQSFNGTHYIQYVPYNSSQMPYVPEGAVLRHPEKGPGGQMYWVIISDKPLPPQTGMQHVQYIPYDTPVTPEDNDMVPGPMFNGTHYIQYVPYKPNQVPKVPQDATIGELYKGPGGQMYWPIIYRRPPQTFNGTHYIQYVPDNASGADVNKPSTGMHHIQPLNATSKPPENHPFWSYGQYAPRPGNGTRPAVNKFPSQKPGTEEHAFWTYGHDRPQNGSQDNYGYKPTTEYPSWSSGQIHNATKVPEIPKLPSGQYGSADHSKPGYEYDSGYYKPDKPEKPSTSEDSYETIDEDHLIEYPSGSDYDETQEQPYGPGTCRYAGKVYVSAQQIPRDDPCDFCFCFRSDIICLQQSCPPPIPGCHEEPIQGFCCPRYECHVRMATLLNVTSTTTTTTTTLPPHFLSHVYKGAAGRTGCFIQGKAYRVGQAIPSASGPCMDCMCGGDGKMKCEPKVCTPEPMVRQMMVSSEKPTTAGHR